MTEAELRPIVARNIAACRKQAGMTQAELAEKLNYSDKTISKWERAEGLPDLVVSQNIAELFGVPLDALLRAPSAAERLHSALPSLCSSCSYRRLCGGPRMRGEMYMRGDSYCGYADFLDEALPTLTGIAAALCRRLRPC